MILSGNGTRDEFLSDDSQRSTRFPNMTKWYSIMAGHPACKSHAEAFIDEMNKQNRVSKPTLEEEDTPRAESKRNSSKHVHFEKEKTVKFGEKSVEIE